MLNTQLNAETETNFSHMWILRRNHETDQIVCIETARYADGRIFPHANTIEKLLRSKVI